MQLKYIQMSSVGRLQFATSRISASNIFFHSCVPSNQKSGSTLQDPVNDLQHTYKGSVAISQMGKEQHRKVKCFVVREDNSS